MTVSRTARVVVCLLVLAALARVASSATPPAELRPLYDALWAVEGTSQLQPKDGDGGKAIGPYQIWRAYWFDATHNTRGVQVFAGDYQDCRDKAYAEEIVYRYWKRYCPKALAALDFETLARTHNGGPGRSGTDGYWRKVQAALK